MTPETPWGKLFASVMLLGGVAFLALPAGIITTGFLEETKFFKKATKPDKCPHCGMPLDTQPGHSHEETHKKNPA
jgi:voltage-gated potassium channel